MARFRLGKTNEARASLTSVRSALEAHLKHVRQIQNESKAWLGWLYLKAYFREAYALIEGIEYDQADRPGKLTQR